MRVMIGAPSHREQSRVGPNATQSCVESQVTEAKRGRVVQWLAKEGERCVILASSMESSKQMTLSLWVRQASVGTRHVTSRV